jgi:hypothetical protein
MYPVIFFLALFAAVVHFFAPGAEAKCLLCFLDATHTALVDGLSLLGLLDVFAAQVEVI